MKKIRDDLYVRLHRGNPQHPRPAFRLWTNTKGFGVRIANCRGMTHKWRFGYGSNLGLTTLRQKKNLNPKRYLVGTVKGWELYFNGGLNEYVEPGFAAIRPGENDLHVRHFLFQTMKPRDLTVRRQDIMSCPSNLLPMMGRSLKMLGSMFQRSHS